jgi:hypothetical protein
MDTNELKQKIEGLLNECPERKASAARAAESDTYNCYTWDDHSHVVKDYCRTIVEFYEIVAEGNPEKIAAFIETEIESLRKSFIRMIEEVNDWY